MTALLPRTALATLAATSAFATLTTGRPVALHRCVVATSQRGNRFDRCDRLSIDRNLRRTRLALAVAFARRPWLARFAWLTRLALDVFRALLFGTRRAFARLAAAPALTPAIVAVAAAVVGLSGCERIGCLCRRRCAILPRLLLPGAIFSLLAAFAGASFSAALATVPAFVIASASIAARLVATITRVATITAISARRRLGRFGRGRRRRLEQR